jgi:dihydroorotate dehydrogenase (NAD+) catalytic subunit
MTTETTFLGVKLKNRSVLASGVLGVSAASLARVYREGAGLVTSKSVGPRKRKGHNSPVIFDWGGGLINAVGLSNPGIDDFVVQYGRVATDFPVIISIYGEHEEEFPVIAEKLQALPHNFIELNLSCPNVSEEFGTPFAHSQKQTAHITSIVRDATDKPIIVKLSPNAPGIVGVGKAAEEAGADALCVINTVGPGMIINTNTAAPLLGNMWGGISGTAILPITVKTVYELYKNVRIPIIGTGGVTDADSALQVLMAGASLYGIGSAVYQKGLGIFRETDDGIKQFLRDNHIQNSSEIIGISHRSKAYSFYKTLHKTGENSRSDKTEYFSSPFTVLPVNMIERNECGRIQTMFFEADELFSHYDAESGSSWATRSSERPLPGQFYMLWIPGVNQKPYSVSYYDGRLIGFTCKRRGCFSEKIFQQNSGDPIGLLGPLGKGFDLSHDNYLLVGGGIGAAPLLFSAIELHRMGKKASLLFGAEGRQWVDWIDPILARGIPDYREMVQYCTEDGSVGLQGMITDHLEDITRQVRPDYALICGPELFTKKSIPILRKLKIEGQASIERMMKCGIGICGSCSVDHTGDRVCVEGPMFDFQYLQRMKEFGSYFMDESGAVIDGGNAAVVNHVADTA